MAELRGGTTIGGYTVFHRGNFSEITSSLGGAAVLNVGTASGTVAAGNHLHSGVYEPANANIQTHVAAVTGAEHGAVATNTANMIVRRDGSGDINIRLLRQEYPGNSGNTNAYFLTQNACGTSDNYARPASAASVRSTLGDTANTASTLVLRDGSGNFSAGTITANLIGNADTATTAYNVPSSDVGGNIWISTVIGGIDSSLTGSLFAPANPALYQIWFDVGEGTIKYWNGSIWMTFSASLA